MIHPDTPLSFEQLEAIAPAFGLGTHMNEAGIISFWDEDSIFAPVSKKRIETPDGEIFAYTTRSLVDYVKELYRDYGYCLAQENIREALGINPQQS